MYSDTQMADILVGIPERLLHPCVNFFFAAASHYIVPAVFFFVIVGESQINVSLWRFVWLWLFHGCVYATAVWPKEAFRKAKISPVLSGRIIYVAKRVPKSHRSVDSKASYCDTKSNMWRCIRVTVPLRSLSTTSWCSFLVTSSIAKENEHPTSCHHPYKRASSLLFSKLSLSVLTLVLTATTIQQTCLEQPV